MGERDRLWLEGLTLKPQSTSEKPNHRVLMNDESPRTLNESHFGYSEPDGLMQSDYLVMND